MEHPVVWFEVMGDEGEKLRGFYGELFGWKITADNPMNYGMVSCDESGRGIPGGIGQRPAKSAHRVTFYVEAKDLEATLSRAEKLGGKRLMEPTAISPETTLALFADPEGNPIGLVKASS